MKKLKVGIIGCGAIGKSLAHWVEKKFSHLAALCFLCDLKKDKAEKLRHELQSSAEIVSLKELIEKSDLVIEAASASISNEVAELGLTQNKMVLIMSVGGLLDSDRWFELAKEGRGRLWIPSGALAGVDGLTAARNGRIDRVKLVTRKPPAGLKEAPYFRDHPFPVLQGSEPVCVFKGTAREAVKAFPQNVNVAAILSLAGIGAEKTEVELWTSSDYRSNEHEVLIEGDSGTIRSVTTNVPSPENVKTSHLAILSAVAVLKKIFSSIEIGT